jgi:hypothetical protein
MCEDFEPQSGSSRIFGRVRNGEFRLRALAVPRRAEILASDSLMCCGHLTRVNGRARGMYKDCFGCCLIWAHMQPTGISKVFTSCMTDVKSEENMHSQPHFATSDLSTWTASVCKRKARKLMFPTAYASWVSRSILGRQMAVVVQRAHTPLLSMQNVDPSSCYQLEVISDN